MSYNPSIEDIDISEGYTPSLEDINEYNIPKGPPSQSMFSMNPQSANKSLQQTFEGKWPKTKEDWLKGLAQMGGAAGMIAQPEFAAGRGLLPYAINTLGRMGQGAAAGTAFQAPELKNKEDFYNALQRNALLSGGMEILAAPFHMARGFGEIKNPLAFTKEKANEIKSGYEDAVQKQQAAYKPVTDKYGNERVAADQVNYLKDLGIEKNKLYTDAKDLYEDFIKKPTFDNLHKLQSQIGRDYASLIGRDKPNTLQRFSKYRNSLKDAAKSFLSKDENALNQYNLGDAITTNQVKPYESTKFLQQIINGKIKKLSPQELAEDIRKGTEKLGNGIPDNHHLNSILNDLDYRISRGEALTQTIPSKIRGYLPEVANEAQNPYLQHKVKNYLNPLFYSYGRTGIGLSGENR